MAELENFCHKLLERDFHSKPNSRAGVPLMHWSERVYNTALINVCLSRHW